MLRKLPFPSLGSLRPLSRKQPSVATELLVVGASWSWGDFWRLMKMPKLKFLKLNFSFQMRILFDVEEDAERPLAIPFKELFEAAEDVAVEPRPFI